MAQVLTKAWSAALLNALGDILAQKIVDKNEHLDMKRLGIFTFLVTNPDPLCSRRLYETICECDTLTLLLTTIPGWLFVLNAIAAQGSHTPAAGLRVHALCAGLCHHRAAPALLVPHAQ